MWAGQPDLLRYCIKGRHQVHGEVHFLAHYRWVQACWAGHPDQERISKHLRSGASQQQLQKTVPKVYVAYVHGRHGCELQ